MNVRALAAGAAAWAASFFLAAPNFRILADPVTYPQRYELFQYQVADPFVRNLGPWDGDFMAYRIAVPLLLHVLHLPAWIGLVVIALAGAALLGVLYAYVEGRTSARTAWLVTTGLALTPLIEGSNIYVGYPDSVSWLAAATLFWWHPPALWAAAAFVMMFNDERGVLALPLVFAALNYEHRTDVRTLLHRGGGAAASIVAGMAVAFAVRWGIATGALGGAPVAGGVLPPTTGFDTVVAAHAAGLTLALKAFWALPILATPVAARETGARPYWIGVALYTTVAIVVSGQVFDFWRSLGWLFPLVVIAVLALHEQRPRALDRALPVATGLMILLPQLEQMNTHIRWLRPLPLAIYEWQTGRSLADLVRQWL